MILTAYFDESGTHKGAETAVMAGHLGDMHQWRRYTRRVSRLFKEYKVDVFHAVDVRHSDDDFAGWSLDRKIEFLDELHHIVNETLELSVAAMIRYEDYDYYRNLDWPKGTQQDTMYSLLFRACMASILDGTLATPRWRRLNEPRLKVVLEEGHKNVGDVERLYASFMTRFKHTKALCGLSFDSKQKCLPLASADLFAYSAWGQEIGQKPIGIPRKPTKSDKSYRGNAYRIPLGRDTLNGLHEQALEVLKQQSL